MRQIVKIIVLMALFGLILGCAAAPKSKTKAQETPKPDLISMEANTALAAGWNVTPTGIKMYQEGLSYYFGVDNSVVQDKAHAFKLFEKAGLEENHPDAAYMAGAILAHLDLADGEAAYVPKDLDRASELFLMAADQEHPKAMTEAGLLILQGHYNNPFVIADVDNRRHVESENELCLRAKGYFEKGVEAGYPRASYGLGIIYEQGWCVDKDLSRARTLYQDAAKAGVHDAKQALKRLP